MFNLKKYYGQNNFLIVKSIIEVIIHVLKFLYTNVECFTSKPNAYGTFWNLHIKISFSLSKLNLLLIGSFYVTHAARALQSHDLSAEGIKLLITDILFDHARTWKASPDEWSARCRGHLRDSTNMKDNIHQAHTHSYQQSEYGMMIMTAAKWYSGTLWA